MSTLKMYSKRTQNTECVNSQSPFGFHLSDGTLYTYVTGNEYEDMFAAWDWNVRINEHLLASFLISVKSSSSPALQSTMAAHR